MALPVIIVDSATGSDSAASGAGPGDGTTSGSALTGAAASYSGSVFTLDGSPDLTNIATDGSHVIYVATSTGRRFFRITAKDNTAKTVTGHTAPSGTTSGLSWAVGGKRATALGTDSWKIFGTPEAETGWVVRMLSGHSELSGGVVCSTSSPGILEGERNAAVMPLITFTNNGIGIDIGGPGQFRNFEVRNNNATKTASSAFYSYIGLGNRSIVSGIVCTHTTDNFARFAYMERVYSILGCHISNQVYDGINVNTQGTSRGVIAGNYIHNNGRYGIGSNGNGLYLSSARVCNNLIINNTSKGMYIPTYGIVYCDNNTVHGNGGDGIYITTEASVVTSNIAFQNGGYGIYLNSNNIIASNNVSANNTSGNWNASPVPDPYALDVSPQFTNPAGADFSIGTSVKGTGWWNGLMPFTGTYTYPDPGAAQRQEYNPAPRTRMRKALRR